MTTTITHTTARAEALRARARHLLELATAIEGTAAFTLLDGAGDDTWRGGRPLLCRNLLSSNRARAGHAVDELRWHAWSLQHQARQLDLQAVLEGDRAG
jgi:hypothetical protein